MKTKPRKDFCLWFVPSDDGRVRKLRISLRQLLCSAASLAVVAGIFIFVAGDYGRVQLLRLRNHLTVQTLLHQRDSLVSLKDRLESQVQSLKTYDNKVQTYEKTLKEKLESLAGIIKSTPFAHATKTTRPETVAEETPADENVDDNGVGGAEIICDTKGSGRCSTDNFDSSANDNVSGASDSVSKLQYDLAPDASRDEMLALLDKYIDIMKVIPVGAPIAGGIHSGFGYRRSPFTRAMSLHEGIDFGVDAGSQVASTGDGVVAAVKFNSTYGLMVDIEHSDRVVTRYAHLSKASVKVGQNISRGDVLGIVGSSGRSTGPHLHYEVRVDDKAQNPMRYIELAKRLLSIFA